MLHLEEGSEFYKEKKFFLLGMKRNADKGLYCCVWFFFKLSLTLVPTFNHQLRRLLVHTLLLLRVSVPRELDLMVISAKGQTMST